jgi:metallo-beta-lactamase family protein
MLTLRSLGGAGTVTGSKHLLSLGDQRLLLDCGLFQGLKNLRELNWKRLPVDAASISEVVLSHAHLDHCGYLPRLLLEGFRGRIHASAATRAVADLILKDAGHLQEKDADYANRKGFSKHHPALPLYRVVDAERALERFDTLPWRRSTPLRCGAQVQLRPAGHILGAATVQIDWGGRTVVFSGDLGRYADPVMVAPEAVPEADYVVVESTYGDRAHPPQDPLEALGAVIERTVRRGGTVVIPAFAVGRAQALQYYLWKLRQSGRLDNVPVYVDSPMASSASDLLQRFAGEHRLDAATCAEVCSVATHVRDVAESKALSADRYPKVIISASGMATGGRVLHHLIAFAPDHRNTVLLSGFQAAGTRGRRLLQGEREIKIFGQWVPVQAEVVDLPMLSAHADADEILRWLGGFRRPPRRVFVVHGEPEASDALRVRIARELGWDAAVPRQDEEFAL